MRPLFACVSFLFWGSLVLSQEKPEQTFRKEVLEGMKKASGYYHSKVASHGGYVYYYSDDLKERWGEGKAGVDTLFVQPPGTPTVGLAYLRAYRATGEKFYLDAARDAALALVKGQLESGGWTQVIHFAKPDKGQVGKYRKGNGGNWNVSSLDDGQTQAALKCLILVDEALNFKDEAIHEAALYGLNALIKAQFPNGAFPQAWREIVDKHPADKHPITKAKLPDYDWKTEGKIKEYYYAYTLNDGVAGTVAETLITAHKVYRDAKSQTSLEKLGDFLVLAQMPSPQPGWCQQYNYSMYPIWARKFEPPAISGWESQDAMRTLIRIAEYTSQKKYLEPVAPAIEYFQKSLLKEGKVARYYEFKTNKPLYMDAEYQLTYDDAEAPAHYGWKQSAKFDEIEKYLKAVQKGESTTKPADKVKLEKAAREILKNLDEKGRWVSVYDNEHLVGQPKFAKGFRYLSSEVFAQNLEALSQYLAATGK